MKCLDAAYMNDGLRITMQSPGQAIRFRQMCYNIRKMFRDKGSPHMWDDLVIRTEGKIVTITIEPNKVVAAETLDGKPVDVKVKSFTERMADEVNNDDILGSLE